MEIAKTIRRRMIGKREVMVKNGNRAWRWLDRLTKAVISHENTYQIKSN